MKKVIALGVVVLAVGALAVAGQRKIHAGQHKWQKAPRQGVVHKTGSTPVKKLANVRHVRNGMKKIHGINFIQYDSGNANAVGNQFAFVYGNRFNSNSGAPIPASAQITQVQWYLGVLSGTGGWVSFYGPPVGTTAPVITAINFSGLVLGMNTKAVAVAPGSDFLAGGLNFASSANPTGNAVAVDQGGTTQGQGFHGMLIHSTLSPVNYAPLPNTNGVFRVYGTSVPVELMQFEVTD
ncbi:MAG: hypothetical protein U0166_18115 [Acidobacteriota bacterium]